MRSCVGRVALLTILLAGSACASSDTPTPLDRNPGDEFEASVFTFFDEVQRCFLQTPHGETVEFKPTDNSNDKYQLLEDTDVVKCRALVRNLNDDDSGLWTLQADFTNGEKRSQSYQLTVRSTTEATSSTTDTSTPEVTTSSTTDTPTPEVTTSSTTDTPTSEVTPEALEVENLPQQVIDTKIGNSHTFEIQDYDFVETEDCFIVTPEGDRVSLREASETYAELKEIVDEKVACGINITVTSEEVVGQWQLISSARRFSSRLERRLPFTIKVEETSSAMPSEVIIAEGNEFHVRLDEPIPNPETCTLLGPDLKEYKDFETDARYMNSCGYIVRDVKASHNGIWQIVHGNRIIYRAFIKVTVEENAVQAQGESFTWTRDEPVSEIFGPENAIYCKVLDLRDFVVFDGFGRCNISLPRATSDLNGNWKMFVGLQGHVLTQETTFRVIIADPQPKAEVVTRVTQNKPLVSLTCSVHTPYEVNTCKFRTPDGRILMANPGVGEDRYTFHGQGNFYESGLTGHECGIQITNPGVQDLGLWRCAVETRNETYYGFLSVLCPHAMRDPEIAAGVVSEPTLTADRQSLSSVEGDSVLMSCSVQSAIRYCYFRARNGTVYNVGPGDSSTDMAEYAGAGLDAGECGIRFRGLGVNDTGLWSCHVGFHDSRPEQRANLAVTVQESMQISVQESQRSLSIRAYVHGRELDYCRFVRIDGFGFTSDSVPEPYKVTDGLKYGTCVLWINSPTTLDRHPWTVAARIRGQGAEITRTTEHTLFIPDPDRPGGPDVVTIYRIPIVWVILMFVGLAMIMTAALVGPKKNRVWMNQRASNLRTSFRNSFTKKAVAQQVTPQNVSERNTANAA